MSYLGKSPTGTGVRSRYYYTATGGETSISGADDSGATLTFTDGAYVDVYLNGVLLVAGTDYNTNTANTIGGLAALAGSDIVEVLVYDTFTVADAVKASSGGTFNGGVTVNGTVTADGLTVDTNTLYVDSTNNRVGIGTTSPSQSLHVVGEGLFEKASADSVVAVNSTGGSGRSYQIRSQTSGDFYIYDNTSGAPRVTINSSGDVGIGTSSPIAQSALTVGGGQGSLSVNGSDGNFSGGGQRAFMDLASGKARIGGTGGGGAGTTLGLYVGTGNEAVSIAASGSVTITSGGLQAIGVYNNTTGTGANVVVDSAGGFARSTSSLRYKNTVNDATHGLTELLALRPVTYKGNNDGDTVFGGLIAEEVHDAGLTEFVTYNEDGEPDALAYGNMVSLCIKAIQEQQATITALEARIAALENA